MFWQENIKEENFIIPDTVQDLSFNIQSKILPIEHSYLLKNALLKHAPWLQNTNTGVFNIGVADGNGWQQDKQGFFYPSKRSKLTLRLAKKDIDKIIKQLVEKTLIMGDYNIFITKSFTIKKLSSIQTIFAKSIICDRNQNENDFLQQIYQQLQKLDITPKKMMAGLTKTIQNNGKELYARSLMIADLKKSESVKLQQQGLGDYKLLGCGIFLPQKDINDINTK